MGISLLSYVTLNRYAVQWGYGGNMMKITLSNQQQAVVEAVSANKSDIAVYARAGTGKTTTILAACGVAKGRVGFFAFNKSIATELAQKAPAGVEVKTLHSLGFEILRKSLGFVTLDNDKTFNIIKAQLSEEEWELMAPSKKLVGLVKNNLIRELTDDNLDALCVQQGITTNGSQSRIFEIVRNTIRESLPRRNSPVRIDFDDMIYLPGYLQLTQVPQYDWVFVDEAQDLNAAQMELIKMISKNGKVCYVGDPYQAIYAFRGADSEAMHTLKKHLNELGRTVIELPLTQTRRCPKAIVELAKSIVSDFEALPEAPDGLVETVSELRAVPGDMVLCRLNAPLVAPAYRMLRAGVPVKIQGKDIGAGLHALIKKLHPTSIEDLLDKLVRYEQQESANLQRKYSNKPSRLESALETLGDKVETLSSLASDQQTIDALSKSIDHLFNDVASSVGIVLLSTIHKAKGLEAQTVHILESKSLKGPQEDNIRYVAMTRAKQSLFYVKEQKEQKEKKDVKNEVE